jgi:hypothetical protein
MLKLSRLQLRISSIPRHCRASLPPHIGRRHATALAIALSVSLLATTVGAQRPQQPIPSPVPFVLADYCEGFEVLITYTDANQYIIRQTNAPDGTSTLKITGHAKVTVTNVTTGKSLSYNISGPGTVITYPTGAFSVDAGGPNLLWTTRANLANYPNVPTLSYTTGRVAFQVDPSGQTTSYTHSGATTDVCAALAG